MIPSVFANQIESQVTEITQLNFRSGSYASFDSYNRKNPKVPDYRRAGISQATFSAFNRAAEALNGQSDLQTFCYRETFAGEGGLKIADNGRVAGISGDILAAAKEANLDGISDNTTLETLTPRQIAVIYRSYIDRCLGRVGGSAALDEVGDAGAAAALVDTVFWFGESGGADLVREAIQNTNGMTMEGSVRLGPVYFRQFCQLAQDPKTRQTLLDNLAEVRTEKAKEMHQFDAARIDHFKFKK